MSMKLMFLTVLFFTPTVARAQKVVMPNPSGQAVISASKKPQAGPYIVGWSAENKEKDKNVTDSSGGGSGPLTIKYSDGTKVVVPNEHGDFAIDKDVLPQQHFEGIQLAEDKKTIGWLADYMMCAQSYPCNLELVIFRSRHVIRTFSPSHGEFWDWKFLKGGEQVATESGYPHGETEGEYALYDISSGRQLGDYTSSGKKPDWVKVFPPP